VFQHLQAASFNPHPASLPGDAPQQQQAHLAHNVSIRTRHRCRVMRLRRPRAQAAASRFNPHPASLPGDAARSAPLLRAPRCFNPHPASLPGDA